MCDLCDNGTTDVDEATVLRIQRSTTAMLTGLAQDFDHLPTMAAEAMIGAVLIESGFQTNQLAVVLAHYVIREYRAETGDAADPDPVEEMAVELADYADDLDDAFPGDGESYLAGLTQLAKVIA